MSSTDTTNWLKTLDAATKAVAKMDPVLVAQTRAALKYTPDPCPYPQRCDEAQTCTGWCHYSKKLK